MTNEQLDRGIKYIEGRKKNNKCDVGLVEMLEAMKEKPEERCYVCGEELYGRYWWTYGKGKFYCMECEEEYAKINKGPARTIKTSEKEGTITREVARKAVKEVCKNKKEPEEGGSICPYCGEYTYECLCAEGWDVSTLEVVNNPNNEETCPTCNGTGHTSDGACTGLCPDCTGDDDLDKPFEAESEYLYQKKIKELEDKLATYEKDGNKHEYN